MSLEATLGMLTESVTTPTINSDPNTLIAVDRGLNRQKWAGTTDWLPTKQAYEAKYKRAWGALKLKSNYL